MMESTNQEISRLKQQVSHWKQKSDRQRAEIAKLLNGKSRRRKYIKRLHAIFDRIGWCFRCDRPTTPLYNYNRDLIGHTCDNCGRSTFKKDAGE